MSIKWHLGNLIDHRILGQSILLRFLSLSSTTKNNDGSPPLLPRDHSSCRCNRWYLTVCRTTLQCAPLAILPAFPEPFLPLRKLRDVDEHLIDRHIFATYVLTQVRVWVWWKAFRSFCRANAVYWWCAAGAFWALCAANFLLSYSIAIFYNLGEAALLMIIGGFLTICRADPVCA